MEETPGLRGNRGWGESRNSPRGFLSSHGEARPPRAATLPAATGSEPGAPQRRSAPREAVPPQPCTSDSQTSRISQRRLRAVRGDKGTPLRGPARSWVRQALQDWSRGA